MSYYGQGDYYRGRGDYYRGDPFSIGGLLKGVAKGVGGVVGGFLKGGPIGAITGGIGAIAGGAGSGQSVILPPPPGIVSQPGSGLSFGGFRALEEGPAPGGKVVKTKGVGGVISRMLPGGSTGYSYVRSRRMNVTNPRALRRAIRRVSGFGKLVQRSKKAIARANTAVGNKSRATKRRGR